MSLRSQILANLRYRLSQMPEIEEGDCTALRITVYTEKTHHRKLDRLVVSAEREWERGPPGIEIAAELDTG